MATSAVNARLLPPPAHDLGVFTAVNMGNPHAVFFVPDAAAAPVAEVGPIIEAAPLFPERTNVEFVSVEAPGVLRMRVWERGAGITRACGSGACAAAVAAHRLKVVEEGPVLVRLDGGALEIDWREDGVYMTGPTALSYYGVLSDAVFRGEDSQRQAE